MINYESAVWNWECYCGESNHAKRQRCQVCGSPKDAFKAKDGSDKKELIIKDAGNISVDELFALDSDGTTWTNKESK